MSDKKFEIRKKKNELKRNYPEMKIDAEPFEMLWLRSSVHAIDTDIGFGFDEHPRIVRFIYWYSKRNKEWRAYM